MNQLERSAGLAATPGYEYARRIGDQLYVAGQVPHDSEGQLVGTGDARAQALQCLQNLRTLLAVHGFAGSDIQRLVVYVVGPQDVLASAWSGVSDWFSGRTPPATLLGVVALGHMGQLVEIDATVIRAASPPSNDAYPYNKQ
jgi:enamine deaminase RidA (YjgF/YER057c/UK114 family)